MAAASTYLGNGIGFIYEVDPDGLTILSNVVNDTDGVQTILKSAVIARNVAPGQVGSGSILINSVDAAGGTISTLTIGGLDQIGAAIVYGAGTTVSQLAVLIQDTINARNQTGGTDYIASAEDDTVYVFPNVTTADTSVNGDTIVVTDASSTSYTTSNVQGASLGNQLYGESWGRRYFINADFDSSGICGGGTAVEGSLTNAIEITDDVINRGINMSIPIEDVTISGGAINYTRKSSIQTIRVDTEASAATDTLTQIGIQKVVTGDIIILRGASGARVTTLNNTGNVGLYNNADFVTGSPAPATQIILQYVGSNQWAEVSRGGNIVSTDATITGDGSVASPLSVATPFTGFTNLSADYGVTLGQVATSNNYFDLSNRPDTDFFTANVSFETNEQAEYKVRMPFKCTVNEVYADVTKAIAVTDDATITPKNNAGTTMTAGVITFVAGTVINTAQTATPTANNTFLAGEVMTIETAKLTAGGKALVTVTLTRTQ